MEYILKENKDGSKITVRDLQLVLLEMMKDIDAICRKNNISYILTGGNALGAVRHKGFIPWDDDFDIAMMKEDYEKFLKVIQTDFPNDKYVCHCYDFDKRYNVTLPSMKIRKKNTYIKEVNSLLENKNMDSEGVFIDVFVYDHMSSHKLFDLPFRLFNVLLMPIIVFFQRFLWNPRLLKSLFVGNAKLYGKLCKKSKYVGDILTWTYRQPFRPAIFLYDDLFPVTYLPFEDTTLPVPKETHRYLCCVFNEKYMEWPPEEKRFAKHTVDISLTSDKPIE